MSGPSTNDNWIGGNAEWSTNDDWSAGTPNGADYAATLSNGATITVGSADFTAYAGTLSISSGSLVIQGGLNLGGLSLTTGSITVNGGELLTGTEVLATTYNQTGDILLENFGALTVETGVNGTVSGTVTLESGGEYLWEDGGASSSSGNVVDFAGTSGGNFVVQASWSGTIEDFNTSNSNDISFAGAISSFSYSTSSKTLTVHTASATYTLNFTDNSTPLTAASFSDAGNTYSINFAGTTYSPPAPAVASATYDASTGKLVVTAAGNGDNFTTNAADFNPTQLTLTGEDGLTYTLTGGAVSNVSSTSFTVSVTAPDQLQVDGLLDNNGTQSTGNDIFNGGQGATIYQIAAGASFDVGGSASSGGVTVSNALAPTITGVSYNPATGVLSLTGTGFEDAGGYGGINLGQITLKNGASSFTFNDQDYGNATSSTTATIDLATTTVTNQQEVQSGEEASVNTLFAGAGPYTLAATSGWDSGAGAAITSLTVTNAGAPTISSESDSSPSGTDIDAGKTVAFTVNFSAAVTATGSPELTLTGSRSASLTSGSGTTALTFSYTVQPGDNVADLEATAFNLNGGTIQNGGVNADLSGFTTINTGVQLDTTAPTVSSIDLVGTSPNNASTDQFTVSFSESVVGVASSAFSLADTGSVTGTIGSVSGSGSSYAVTVTGVTGDGTLGLDLKSSGTGITDIAGNAISGGFTSGQAYTIEHTPPTVLSIDRVGGTPNNASSEAFTVTFSESVTGVVGGDFSAVTTGTIGDTGLTVSGNGTTYTVTANGVTGDGTLGLNLTSAGAIQDETGNALSTNSFTGQVYTIEHTPPALGTESFNSASGTDIDAGKVVTFTIAVSEPVTVTNGGNGLPTLQLNDSEVATYSGLTGSSVNSLTFSYTVQAGDNVADLKATGFNSLPANTTIQDAAGNNIDLSGFSAIDTGVQVDTTAPTLGVESFNSASGTDIDVGKMVTFTIAVSEPVTVTNGGNGLPTLQLNDSEVATYSGLTGSSVNSLTFSYTVQASDNVADLKATGFNSLPVNTTIQDAAGNNIDLSGFSAIDTGVQVDTTAPTLGVESFNSASGTDVDAGKVVTFTIAVSEPVTVTNGGNGLPTLQLNDSEVATYSGPTGSSVNSLTFSYMVQASDNVADLKATGFNSLPTNTTIQDAAGNNIDLSGFSAIDTGVKVDTTAPTTLSITDVGTSPNNASSDAFTVTFSESVTGVVAHDFAPVPGGTVADTGVTVTPVSGSVYTVTVNGVSGDGTLGLHLNSSGTGIADLAGNPISGGFSGGQTYTIDHGPQITAGLTVTGTQGVSTGSVAVATFTDAAFTSPTTGDFTATINWGDGTAASTGTVIAENGGLFAVDGAHTYAAEGSFTIGVTVADTNNDSENADSTATIMYAAPTIVGTVANQSTLAEAPVKPFSGVTISDTNAGATDTLTITLPDTSAKLGTLSGSGLTGSGPTYQLAGTAAAITTELDALSFTPVNGVPATSVINIFDLSDQSSLFATPTTNDTTSVIDTDLAIPPTPAINFPNVANSNVDEWILTDGEFAANAQPGSIPSGYQVAGTGDFTGNGTSDILWQNPTTGDTQEWLINNGAWAGTVDLGSHPGNYQIAGVGDFTGNGIDDVLWTSTSSTGQMQTDIWELGSSGQWTASVSPGSHPAGYNVVGVGDFTGNGTDDILWQNPTTGDVDEWQIANGQWSASVDLGSHPGTGWTIAGVGDFTGNGIDDILWTNSNGPNSNIQVDIWELGSNGQWAASLTPGLGYHPPGYQVAAIGDFTGNGTDGVLWQDPSNGNVDEWVLGNNAQWAESVNLGTHPGNFQIAGTGSFVNGNSTSDILWQAAK